jgi:transcriptional antiterminator RfaH
MERKWFIICTKQKQERNVTRALTKKGIENFCPFGISTRKSGARTVTQYGPLFNSYVFVNITETQVEDVKKLPGVVNTLYWKAKPVVIKDEVAEAIKLVSDNYTSIKLEKTQVCMEKPMWFEETNTTSLRNNFLAIEHNGVKLNLPQLGCILIADRGQEKDSFLSKQKTTASSLLRSFVPSFLFGF